MEYRLLFGGCQTTFNFYSARLAGALAPIVWSLPLKRETRRQSGGVEKRVRLSANRGNWMREKWRERLAERKRKSYQRGPEETRGEGGGEENPRIVGISIHPNIRASSANTGWSSHPSRYQIIALCCATALYFPSLSPPRYPFLLPSLFANSPFSVGSM